MTAWPEDITILIPAYKAAQLLQRWLPSLLQRVPRERILIVDDASKDHTVELCRTLDITRLQHDSNRGKGGALSTGFRHLLNGNARWIITMDADGQHAIEDLPRFVEQIQRQPDLGMIIGYRDIHPRSMPLARIMSNRMTSAALSILIGCKVIDSQSGYRAYSAQMLRTVLPFRYSRFEMESEVILRAAHAGYAIGAVPVKTLYFRGGDSHISHLMDTLRWMRSVISVYVELRRSSPRHICSNPK